MATSTLLPDEDENLVNSIHGHDNADLGPSDTSDSGSDVAGLARGDSDTDSQGTGERVSVNPGDRDRSGADLVPNDVIEEEELARSSTGDRDDDAGGDPAVDND